MNEHYQTLLGLMEASPDIYSSTGYSQLNTILNKYLAVLRHCTYYNDEFKKAANLYYTDISSIRDNIEYSFYGESLPEKKIAFDCASRDLKSNIQALAKLIQQKERYLEIA